MCLFLVCWNTILFQQFVQEIGDNLLMGIPGQFAFNVTKHFLYSV